MTLTVIKRVGFGYKNFTFFRIRLLYILNGKILGKVKKRWFLKKTKNKKMKKFKKYKKDTKLAIKKCIKKITIENTY